ncbi:undecaprenyl-phosphate glucose phosphotransferase, partial [Pseudomonas syringae pv. actinidiae]|nr:undecaprenyl-phosphate glucose phosphotransferase [Pseudomonas syringae pv. actinidiae]
MRLQPVGSLSLTRTSLVEYFLFGIRLAHGVACILPGLAILLLIKDNSLQTPQSYLTMLLFFGCVGVLVFQAMGVYSEALFSNDLRMGAMALAWTAAFGLLLFMQQAMGLFGYLSNEELLIWYLTSLALFGVIRLLLLML